MTAQTTAYDKAAEELGDSLHTFKNLLFYVTMPNVNVEIRL
jgi:hypothetical protein